MKKTTTFILIILLSIATLSILTINPSQAQEGTRIYTVPSTIIRYYNDTYVGYRFNVTFWIETDQEVGGVQINTIFKHNIINVTQWWEPKWDPNYIFYGKTTSALPFPPNPGYTQINATHSRSKIGVNLFPPPPGQEPFTGTGLIAILEFEVKVIPPENETYTSPILIDNPDTYIMLADGTQLKEFTKENGYYEIHGPPPPPTGTRIFVDPPEIIDPTMTPSSIFDINITIDDFLDMKVCIFNLSYDPNVIGYVTFEIFRINGEFPTSKIIADDEAGYVWVKLNYSTPVTTYDPLALIQITFHVETYGSTPLDLHDTNITDPTGTPIEHDVYDGFFATLIRDVAVTDIIPSRTWAYEGTPINITVTVKNKGNVSETFDLTLYYDSNIIETKTVTDLPSGEEKNVTFTWDTTGIPEGNYTISAEASYVPYEFDPTDNSLTDGTIWIMERIHDVAIIDVVVPRSWVYQGWQINITVTAKNQGNFTETFDVTLYFNQTQIKTWNIIDLPAGEKIELQVTLNTSQFQPCSNFSIWAEASEVPYEYNLTNNIFYDGYLKIRLYGDINGDGVIDLVDVYAVSMAFGTYEGHPNWNPDADLNQDGQIDLFDVYMVSKNFAKEC